MNVIIIGYHEIACTTLEEMKNHGFNIVAVIPNPIRSDQHSYWYRDISVVAKEHGIEVWKVSKLRNNFKLFNKIRKSNIDIIFSCFSSFIFPDKMIELAKYCCLNFHNSDLPKYKGRAAPIWAVINNEPQIAMTLHLIRAKEAIDSGLIIDKEFVKINKKDDMKRIYQKLNLAQLKILRRKLPELIKKRKFLNIKNISHDFVYSWNDTKDRELDLEEMTPLKITNTIRALKFPFSGAYLKNNKKLIISSCDPLNIKLDENLPNGVILSLGEYDVIVKVFKGAIKIKDVIFQGRNILPSHYCLIKNLKKYDLFN